MSYIPGVFTITGMVLIGSGQQMMVLTIGSSLTPATEEIAAVIASILMERGFLVTNPVTILPGSDSTPPPPI